MTRFFGHRFSPVLSTRLSLLVECETMGKVGSQSSDSDQTPLVTSLSSIEGFWLIERFEDFEPSWQNDTPWRSAYIQINDGHMAYSVGCNRSGKAVSLSRDGILQNTDDGLSVQTLVGCGPVLEARDRRVFAFFGSNPEVRNLGASRLSLTSKSGDLVFDRPEPGEDLTDLIFPK